MSIGEKFELIADAVYDKGKQSEYDTFWDSYQQNGNRTYYLLAFGYQWTSTCFRPKYDLRPTNASQMFYSSNITDVQDCLDKAGVVLDLSKATSFRGLVSSGAVTRLGVIDTTGSTTLDGIFNSGTNLHTVELFIIKEDGSQTQGQDRPFANANALKNITVQGKFGLTVSMEWCPLSKASIISVVNALTENASMASGKKLTLKSSAVTSAFGSTTAQEWTNLITPKQNAGWTITLV